MPKEKKRSLDRRRFLERVSGGVVGAGIGMGLLGESLVARSAQPKLERRNEQSGMVYRRFGKTNLNVSRLSYGCIKLQDDRLPVLEMAVERGVNLVHVSETYNRGRAIRSLGKFLKTPGNRDKVWVALKGHHGKGVPDNIDDQLKILNTDHVDIITCPIFDPDRIHNSQDQLEKFEALKKAGKVRFLNLTTHKSLQQGMDAGIDARHFSSILSVIDLTNVKQFEPVIRRANRENVGIMAMKTVRGGKEVADKITAALYSAGVTTILRSIITRQQLDLWFNAVPKAPQEMAALPADCELVQSGLCTLCGECERCPNGVAIQDVVRDYTYYYEQQGLLDLARERYAEIDPRHTVLACRDCGRCEEICPRDVPVRRIIREAHQRLGGMA